MKDLRVVFMGTPEFAINILEGLIEISNVVLVVSQPDKEVGRKRELKHTPIKEVALVNNIEVFQPIKIKEDYQRIMEVNPDIIITCAYGQIIPDELLNFPKYKAINVHASLLPSLRGGAPIHKAIIYGLDKTGITIMDMVSKMDAGDIIKQVETKILDSDNVGTLHDRLSLMGKELLLETLPSIIMGTATRIKQDESKVTYGYNVSREEELIDFNKDIRSVFNQIRGLNPFPGAYANLDGKIIKIYSSRIGDIVNKEYVNGEIINVYKDGFGVYVNNYELIVTEFQLDGKKKMLVKDYFNGYDGEKMIGLIFNK